MDIIVYPDAETHVIAYLDALLPVPVADAVPEERPASFVTVVRTGGTSVLQVVEGAALDIECWADTKLAAFDVAQIVQGLMNRIPSAPEYPAQIHDVLWLGTPANLPDPRTLQARYVMKAQLNQRAVRRTI